MKRRIKLVVFDLDGTLTKIESIWQYLHQRLGTWHLGKISAEKYWCGKLSYQDWAREDSSIWRGVTLEEMLSIISDIPYTRGARETVEELKKHRILVGIVSAGLSFLADKAKIDLNADFTVANELAVKDGKLTGEIRVKVSLENKCDAIREMAWMLGVEMAECAVVGDNVFDLPGDAGLKIAFNPKSKETEEVADVIVKSDDLRDVLNYILNDLK